MTNKGIYLKIDHLIKTDNEKFSQLSASHYLKNGILPIIDQSSSFICGYTNDLSRRYSKQLPVIVFGDHTLQVKYVDFDFATGADGTQILRPLDSNTSTKYLYYLICRETELMGSEGYKRHFSLLKEREVPYFSNRSEQQKIAEILTSVDEVIENTQSQINKLGDLKKATINELLTKGIGHTEFKETEMGRIPRGWSVVTLGSVITTLTDYTANGSFASLKENVTYYNEKNYSALVRTTDLEKDFFRPERHVDQKAYEYLSKSKLFEGDIVIANVGSAGRAYKVPRYYLPLTLAPNMYLVRFNENQLLNDYAYYYLIWDVTLKELRKGFGVTTLSAFNKTTFKDLKIYLPQVAEQQKICNAISSHEAVIKEIRQKCEVLKNFKKSLMQDLLTGKVRVTVN